MVSKIFFASAFPSGAAASKFLRIHREACDRFGSVHPEFLCCICLEVLVEPYVRRDVRHRKRITCCVFVVPFLVLILWRRYEMQ